MITILKIITPIFLICFCTVIQGQNFSNWGYWLTDIDPQIVSKSEYDLVVIDYSRTGDDEFSKEEVSSMKKMDSGEKRKVVSYFSIGEAEEYRYYWKKEWNDIQPSWIEKENPDWPGNYKVKYWNTKWQDILFGNEEAYLDKIINAGFDGIYLDIIDAFEYFEPTRPSAEYEMVELIKSISTYAKSINPYFIIITQNGERLLAHEDLLAAIDGASKEDLYFGLEGDHIPVSQSEIDYSLEFLLEAKEKNKFVLIASYVPNTMGKEHVSKQCAENNFIPYFGNRDLDVLFKNSDYGKEHIKTSTKLSSTSLRTPGDFFLNTLYKGQFKSSFAGLMYDEQSIYSESDDEGNLEFSEKVSYNDILMPLTLKYGIADNFEVGIRLPISRTKISLQETFGGDEKSEISGIGLGNIGLLANISIPFKEKSNIFSLLSMEYGLPTDTKKDELKSSSFFALNYTIEKIWNNWGIALGSGLNNYNLSESLGETQFVYKGGLLGIFSERIFGDIFYTRVGNQSFIEVSSELLVTRNSSIDLYFSTDIQKGIEIRNVGITYTIFH